METRSSKKDQTQPLWNIPYSPHLLEEIRSSEIIQDTQKLKVMYPQLSTLLEQPVGTKLELETVEFDRTGMTLIHAQPSLIRSHGYFLLVQTYGKTRKYDGPCLEVQYEGSTIVEEIPLLRYFNAEESLQALPKRRELTVGSKRFHKLSQYLIGQSTKILRWEDKAILFHNQNLEEQLAEFEEGLQSRKN